MNGGTPSDVVAIVLCDGAWIYADSTSTYKVEDWVVRQLQGLLPRAVAMELHWLLEDVSANEIDWNIDAYPGWDRDHENAAVSFFGTDSTAVGRSPTSALRAARPVPTSTSRQRTPTPMRERWMAR